MYTSLLGEVTLGVSTWHDVLTLSLPPGVYFLIGSVQLKANANGNVWEARFTDGTTIYGSAGGSATYFSTPNQFSHVKLIGVADLSAALVNTDVKLQGFVSPAGGATNAWAEPGTGLSNTAGATFLIALLDVSATLNAILAAVSHTYPAS